VPNEITQSELERDVSGTSKGPVPVPERTISGTSKRLVPVPERTISGTRGGHFLALGCFCPGNSG
jgi:hypothetical protein